MNAAPAAAYRHSDSDCGEARTAQSAICCIRGDAPFAVMHGDGGYVYMVACSLVAATKEQTAMPNTDCWDRGWDATAVEAVGSLAVCGAGHVDGPLHSGPHRAAVSLFLRMEVSRTACTMPPCVLLPSVFYPQAQSLRSTERARPGQGSA